MSTVPGVFVLTIAGIFLKNQVQMKDVYTTILGFILEQSTKNLILVC